MLAREGNIGLALARIVGRERERDQLGPRAGLRDDLFGGLPNREFDRIAEVDRAGEIRRQIRQREQLPNQIVDLGGVDKLAHP